MRPRNGYFDDGLEQNQFKFKKRGKKLNNYQKQKPKYKNQFFDEFDDKLDDIIEDGMNLNLRSILGEDDI